MNDVLEVMDSAVNVEFKEFTYFKEEDVELATFKIIEPSAEDWNKRARKQNIKMYIEINKRIPKDYQEVLTWIYSSEKEENHLAGNEMALFNL
ncbi:hypothetical protein [Metabacillus litoralis]|uniref:hypothetical protein n=1 Tax=Metabacillus litoralis TaxID=152268 RepID=UPI00203C7AC4|nr:hypothetical protein [Metabacillus litoralis]MCM3165098.1 hypothetical protein [Metabacillus litoralis]